MRDTGKAKAQLIADLNELRARMAELEAKAVEQSRAVQELQMSEERYRTLVEENPYGVQEITADGTIVFANRAHHELYGYKNAALIGRHIADFLVPGPQRDELLRYLKTLVKDQPSPTPYHQRILTKDRRERDIDVNWNYLRDAAGRVRGFISVLTDITERKLTETALLKSESLYRDRLVELDHIYQTVPVGLCVIDTEMRYVRINEQLAAINGRPASEHIGLTLRDVVPNIADQAESVYRQVFESGEPVLNVKMYGVTPSDPKTERYWLVNYHPLGDADGHVIGVSLVVQDITELQRAEEALQAAYEQMEDRVRKRTKELRNLATRLQSAREEERANFAREIHDNLGQMLTRIHMDLAVARDQLSNPLTDSTREKLLELVDSMSDRTTAIIESTQQTAYRLRPSMLDDLGLSDAMDWEAKSWQSRTGIDCDLEHVRDDLKLPKDVATAVFRIFQEALSNVYHHACATRVEVSLERRRDVIYLSVIDNGGGIAEPKIDDLHSLGLIGMRERAVLLDGELKIRGTRGKGTEVRLTFPLRRGAGDRD